MFFDYYVYWQIYCIFGGEWSQRDIFIEKLGIK